MRLRKLMDRQVLARDNGPELVTLRVQLRLAMARWSYMDEVTAAHLEFARVDRHVGDEVAVRRHVALAKQFHREGRVAQRQAYMIREAMARVQRQGRDREGRTLNDQLAAGNAWTGDGREPQPKPKDDTTAFIWPSLPRFGML
jgi:hypothetical protein